MYEYLDCEIYEDDGRRVCMRRNISCPLIEVFTRSENLLITIRRRRKIKVTIKIIVVVIQSFMKRTFFPGW